MILRLAHGPLLGATLGLLAGTGAFAQGPLVIARAADGERYDPARVTSRSVGDLVFLLADTLLSLDWDLKTVKPLLAKSWSVSSDGKIYTFALRDDVRFCDGRPMTADDVVYSLKRWIAPETKSSSATRAGKVRDIRASDPLTVVYELDEAHGELPLQLTQFFSSIVDRAAVERLGADFGVKGFNGTGPYCWESWVPRQEFVMTRNPHYRWGPEIYDNRGPAQVEKIVWKILPEDSARLAALSTGSVHLTQFVPFVALDQVMATPTLKVAAAPNYLWTWYVGFKVDREPMSDVRVRRAFSLAIDQDALARSIWFGHASPARTAVNPDAPGFNPRTLDVALRHDPARAKALLDEAGWAVGADGFRYKDGKKLAPVLYGFTSSPSRQIVEAIQGEVRKIGFDLQVSLFDPSIGWSKLRSQEFDAFPMSYPYLSVADAYGSYFASSAVPAPNRMNWKDARTDDLLARGAAAPTDDERRRHFDEVQMLIQDAAVWLPIVHERLFLTATARLDGVRAHGIYGCGIYKGLDIRWR